LLADLAQRECHPSSRRLKAEWDATAELVCYYHDGRVDAWADLAEVLADLENAMRSFVPIPHRVVRVNDIGQRH
jgi:hypothetical protein